MFNSKNFIRLICLVAFIIAPLCLKADTIDYPDVGYTNAQNTKIVRIERLENFTIVTFNYEKTMPDEYQGWVSISSKTFLRWGNTDYKILRLGNNEQLDKKYSTTGKIGDTYETVMVFPPIPLVAKTIDIVENSKDGWKWQNISLVTSTEKSNQFNLLKTSYNEVADVGYAETKLIDVYKNISARNDFLDISFQAGYIFSKSKPKSIPFGEMVTIELFVMTPPGKNYGLNNNPTLKITADNIEYNLGQLEFSSKDSIFRSEAAMRAFTTYVELKKFSTIANSQNVTLEVSGKKFDVIETRKVVLAFQELIKDISERSKILQDAQNQSNQTNSNNVSNQNNVPIENSIDYTKITPKKISSILEITSDMPSFIDVPVKINGSIKISTYYNYEYGKSQETHLAFEISDETGSAHLYMLRGEQAQELRNQLIKAGAKNQLYGAFTFVIRKDRFDKTSNHLLAELLSWSSPEDNSSISIPNK